MSDADLEVAAERLRKALSSGDRTSIGAVLADDVVWGDCHGRAEVESMIAGAGDLSAHQVDLVVVDGRLVLSLRAGDPADATEVHLALFLRDGRIAEIVQTDSRDQARVATPVGELRLAAGRASRLERAACVLPVRNVGAALAHYARLGFDTHPFEGDAPYGFAERDGVSLHLAGVDELDPATTTSAVYLYVTDADALFAEWRLSGATGRFVAPEDADYGLREGAHVDPDGNLIRFGSPL